MKNDFILQLTDINKEYKRSDGSPATPVLSGISISIREGESISIIGPSGSGKSTLLNIMGALDRPTSGKVFFNGDDLSEIRDDSLSFFRNREIGFVFQQHHLLPQCTVLENVLIPTLPFPARKQKEYYETGVELLEYVGMGKRLHHKPAELSSGEQLRTAVIRALINDPKILLADEPTGSLDNRTAKELSGLLVQLNKEKNLTLVVVTHSEEMAEVMNKKYELKDGNLKPIE